MTEKSKPQLLWAFPEGLGGTPLELFAAAHRRRGDRGMVPVVVVPLTQLAHNGTIEANLAEFEAHGIRVQVTVIAGKRMTAKPRRGPRI